MLKSVLLLVIVYGILEGILRFSSYNRNFVLFSKSKTNAGIMELSVKSHHSGPVFSVPFKRFKEKGCFRVFIAGEPGGTVQPENPNVSFSHILNGFLQQAFPEKKIELVNLALDSQNYITQYEAIRQLKSCEADLVLLWPEWKSTCYQKSSCGSRVIRLVKDLTGGSKQAMEPTPADYRKSMERFEKDLDKTISFLQDHNISVVVLNTCSNLDFLPLRSAFASFDGIRLQELFEKGKAAYFNHDYEKALAYLSVVNQRDGFHAGTCYYLGKLALRNNDPATARRLLRKAADNDREQLRPPSGIHAIIARQSAIHGIPYIDTDKAFQLFSKEGIPGSNLFSGVQQPNLTGNIIIARECYRAILKGNYLNENQQPDPKNLAITPFDMIYDQICSAKGLQENPDFMKLHISGIMPFEEKTADLFEARKISWEASMNQLYAHYIENRKYDQALRVIENLALENPYDISVNNQASITASLLGDSQKVVHYAKKVFGMKPEQEIAKRIFIHYLKLDRPAEALPYLEYARRNDDHALDMIYTTTLQVIDLKKQLEHDSANPEIRKQIAFRYGEMGNDELARWYGNPR